MQGDYALHLTSPEAATDAVSTPRPDETGRLGALSTPAAGTGVPEAVLRDEAALRDAVVAAHAKVSAADARLADAHDEAQSIISDALEQAALVAARAEAAAEELVTDARGDAERRVNDAQVTARVLREQAEAVIASVRQHDQQQRAELATELEGRRAAHDEALRIEQARFVERLAGEEAALLGQAHAELDEARAESTRLTEAARIATEDARCAVEDARLDAETMRANAHADGIDVVDAARREAARELALAVEQTDWTHRTMTGLLAAAEVDAKRTRRNAHRDAELVLRRSRLRVVQVLEAARLHLQARNDLAARERAVLAQQTLEAAKRAEAYAAHVREAARAESERLLAEADDSAGARAERAERRLAEAEAGARTVRERAADDLARSQREMSDLRRTSRDAAAEGVAEARAEADDLRKQARGMLADARAEVAVLTAHRDAIARELGDLSGVIEALAVAGRPIPRPTVAATLAAPPADPGPQNHQQSDSTR